MGKNRSTGGGGCFQAWKAKEQKHPERRVTGLPLPLARTPRQFVGCLGRWDSRALSSHSVFTFNMQKVPDTERWSKEPSTFRSMSPESGNVFP